MKTIIEPFRIKTVDPIKMTTRAEREVILANAHYNPFLVRSENVIIDLLTDSGTSAMSSAQWSGLMRGDESYAGSRSFFRFEDKVKDIFGFKFILPTHQGRAAERILFGITAEKGHVVPNNTHFDTTRANCENNGMLAVDFPIPEGKEPKTIHPFKGNIDLKLLEKFIQEKGKDHVPFGMCTITNNTCGGQPVSMANIKGLKKLLQRHKIPLIIDACRFAENCWFIKQREKGFHNKSPLEIARELFSHADGCTMSAKKDGLVNMGGFLAFNNEEWFERAKKLLILTEGYPTYGGLAARDLEAIAIGLDEVLDEHYLEYRQASIAYLANSLTRAGIPILLPPGGHAIYLDAKEFLPHIRPEDFPGQSLVAEIFLEGGVRSCEIGSLMFGKFDPKGHFIPANMELVRLAIPRRSYTQSHIDYVAETVGLVFHRRDKIKKLKCIHRPDVLPHFTARFKRG